MRELPHANFELADLAKVVGISLVTAKNWTNGRTLSIAPSVHEAKGRGSRNIYNVWDAYTLAYALRLRERGIALSMIRALFEEFNKPGGEVVKFLVSSPEVIWLVVTFDPKGFVVDPIFQSRIDNPELGPEPLKLTETGDDIFQYAVNVRSLREKIDARIKALFTEDIR